MKTDTDMAFESIGKVRIVAQLACIVYDEDDGSVVHGHGAVCLEGSEVPDEVAFQERALRLARQTGDLDSRRLRAMMVDLAEMSAGLMRVDLASRRLVIDESQSPEVQNAGQRG